MKLDKIELDLCVNIVPYPHEEINELEQKIKFYEEDALVSYNSIDNLRCELQEAYDEVTELTDKVFNLESAVRVYDNQGKDFYTRWRNSCDELTKERTLTNEMLMVSQHWKKKFEELENTCKKTEKELSSTTLLYEAYQDNYELLGEKYNKLLESHAKVLEEQQYFEGKEKFYHTLLKPSVRIVDFLDKLNEQDELPKNNTLIFCTNNYQAVALKDLIKSYNNVIVNTVGSNYTFPNGARLFVKVVKNTEEAYTRYGGLVGNNVLVNSSMKSDVELCQWACSRARNTGKGYQPEFIVYDF